MFNVGDRITHPMHGAGVVEDIVQRRVAGVTRSYYVLRIPVGEMKVMIPTESTASIGVRPVVGAHEARSILSAMAELKVDVIQNWNQRYRDNMEKLRSGDLTEVARVIKCLMLRDKIKSLSTGERRMLHSAKQIFMSELVLVLDTSAEKIEAFITQACTCEAAAN